MGVDINRTIAITFLIGSALAGAAGVVQGLLLRQRPVQPRLPGRPEGVHRGRPRRHRQHRPAPRSAASSSASSRSTAAALGLFALGPGASCSASSSSCSCSARPASSASSSENGHERDVRTSRQAAPGRRPACARDRCATFSERHRSLERSSSAWRSSRRRPAASIVAAAAVQRLQRPERLDRRLHQRRHLRPAGARPEHRRRHGRPARPRLRRVLRDRRVHLRLRGVAVHRQLDFPFWPMLLVGAGDRGALRRSCSARRRCACAATTWRSSPSASARSCRSCSSTRRRTPTAPTASAGIDAAGDRRSSALPDHRQPVAVLPDDARADHRRR